MKRLLIFFCLFYTTIYSTPFFNKDTAAFAMSTAISTAFMASVYEIGKRKLLPSLTNYLKKGQHTVKISFGTKWLDNKTNPGPWNLKIGFDAVVWGNSIFISGSFLRSLICFQENNGMWAFGTMVGSIISTSIWAQTIPERYNPFIWKQDDGSNEPILMWASWKTIINADGSCYKVKR